MECSLWVRLEDWPTLCVPTGSWDMSCGLALVGVLGVLSR